METKTSVRAASERLVPVTIETIVPTVRHDSVISITPNAGSNGRADNDVHAV
jgi:hypothetical protein